MIIRVISFISLVFFCTIGLISLQIVDKEKTWNITETALNSALINSTQNFKINPNAVSMEEITLNIVKKIVDTMIYVTIQLTRIVSRYAIENPQINFRLILNLVMLALILMIAVPLIKVSLIFYVLIKDFIDERKYKRKIREIKNKKEDLKK